MFLSTFSVCHKSPEVRLLNLEYKLTFNKSVESVIVDHRGSSWADFKKATAHHSCLNEKDQTILPELIKPL